MFMVAAVDLLRYSGWLNTVGAVTLNCNVFGYRRVCGNRWLTVLAPSNVHVTVLSGCRVEEEVS